MERRFEVTFDPDLVDLLVRRTRELGIRVELDVEVLGVDSGAGGLAVRGRQRGTERRFETDMAVHGAGRVPELDDLDLDTAGVKREKRGVIVNEYLQSVSNPAVYAGGDAAASGPALTPKADHDAGVLATNLLEGNRRAVKTASGFKVLIAEGTGRILGAHLLGPHAAEVINLFAMAIRLRISANDVKQVLFAYPTGGSDIRFVL